MVRSEGGAEKRFAFTSKGKDHGVVLMGLQLYAWLTKSDLEHMARKGRHIVVP